MKQTHRFVTRIEPHWRSTFDQQFWPVLVAMFVLASIVTGAILTLLRGPWMWGSLLVLPAAVVISIFVLYRVNNRRLRRSFQLALMISLAVHLVVLMMASVTQVFNNPFQSEQPQTAQRPQKTITIRNRTTPFIWQKSNQKPTPEPEVEIEREQPETTVEQPQPVPVKSMPSQPQPQVVRREEVRPTVPRRDQHLSQLRRQTENQKPRSSNSDASLATQVSKSSPSQRSSAQPSQVEAQRSREGASAQRAAPSDAPSSESRPLAAASQRRTALLSDSVAVESRTDKKVNQNRLQSQPARRAALAVDQFLAAPASPVKSVAKKNVAQPIEARRSQAAPRTQKTDVVVQPVRARAVAQSARRRDSNVRQPTLSSPTSKLTESRRSIINAPVTRTTANLESPAPPVAAAAESRNPSAQSLAVTKSIAGRAGGGRSANLEKGAGSATSPTEIASSATAERRTDNRPESSLALSSQQQSTKGRRTAKNPAPQSALRATTQFQARLQGHRQPNSKTASAASTQVDSRSQAELTDSAAEKGESRLEQGPTKIVMEDLSERRGGGGQPELSELASESKSPSGRVQSQRTPTVMAVTQGAAQAASNPRSAPMSSEQGQADAAADAVARSQPSDGAQRGLAADGEQAGMNQDVSANLQPTGSRTQADATNEVAEIKADAAKQRLDDPARGARSSRTSPSPALVAGVDFDAPDSDSPDSDSIASASASSNEQDSQSSLVEQRPTDQQYRGALNRTGSAEGLLSETTLRNRSIGQVGRRSTEVRLSGQNSDQQSSGNRRKVVSAAKPSLSEAVAKSDRPPRDAMDNSESAVDPTATRVARALGSGEDRQAGAALVVDAAEGAAGLSDTPTVRLGVRSRPAAEDSPNIAMQTETRFKRPDFGGNPAVNPAAVLAKNAFRSRSRGSAANAPPSTEAAIQNGLEFLARHQAENGGWSLIGFDSDPSLSQYQIDSDTAATGLAVLAFQGAGYNHREFKYADQLQRALKWMVDHQQPDGGLYVESDTQSNASAHLYSHAIAALALTEAYGMTQDPELERPAQKALDYIAATQDSQRGGWRYFVDPQRRSSDTSVTGWMMMALKSGRLAGLKVRPSTLSGIEGWLQVAVDSKTESQFRYNPYAVDGKNVDGEDVPRSRGRQISRSMTAVGLLMRVYSGWSRQDERFLAGAESLLEQLPSDATTTLRDTYYWYYATQVLKHAGGDSWETWNQALHPLLLRTQVKAGEMAGSWHPYRPVPDRWGAHGGRLYVTTLNLLSLEVRYRLLPLYDNIVSQESIDSKGTR